jgi:hypothetical protein
MWKLTEVTCQEGLGGIWGPFAIHDLTLSIHVESVVIDALRKLLGQRRMVRGHERLGWLALENLSRPPSVVLILSIHSCAFENLLLKASWKGDSQGSSLTTPATCQVRFVSGVTSNIPVPSLGISSAVALPFGARALAEFSTADMMTAGGGRGYEMKLRGNHVCQFECFAMKTCNGRTAKRGGGDGFVGRSNEVGDERW